jgi:hypothetical protein
MVTLGDEEEREELLDAGCRRTQRTAVEEFKLDRPGPDHGVIVSCS